MPVDNVFIADGKPLYQIIRPIGKGGSSRCYQVRRVLPDGALGRYYVVKQFWPQPLAEYLDSGWDQSVSLKPGHEELQAVFDTLLAQFQAEPDLSGAVNQSAGGGSGNYPWVFHSERVPGRSDLLLIDTENGYTVDEFAQKQRSTVLSSRYVALCLTILSRLLDSLKGIHRGGMLHLDVKPQNVYIVTQEPHLAPDSAFSVKLLDLASAVPKELFLSGQDEETLEKWENAAFSDGYSDPLLGQMYEAASCGMLEKFRKRSVIDERADWYSAASVLYYMLTGSDSVQEDCAYIALPRKGFLEDDAIRSDLEEVLSRALRIMPYGENEVPENKFLQDINQLLYRVNFSISHGADKTPEASAFVRSDASASGLLVSLTAAPAKDGRLWQFTGEENRLYGLQSQVLCPDLPESENRLAYYTCHALPHIQEVMEETERLYQALQPWLQNYIPADQLEDAHRHLVLSAKLHDIGMAGTPELRELLTTVDQLYSLTDTSLSANTGALYERLAALGKAAELETTWFHFLLHTRPDSAGMARQNIQKALCAYHDEIKKAIRDRHADTSGRYILAHRAELAAQYGDDFDWAEIALLAALHSNSARDYIAASAPNGRLSAEYCHLFLDFYGDPKDAGRICQQAALLRLFAEATLIRLADARRSGTRLRLLDSSPIVIDRTPGGRFILSFIRGEVHGNIPFSDSREIVLAEACNDFGTVLFVDGEENRCQIRHRMRVKYCDSAEIRRLFRDSRIVSYISELSSAFLEPTEKLRHVFEVEAEGLEAETAREWAASFRLPAGYTVEIHPLGNKRRSHGR